MIIVIGNFTVILVYSTAKKLRHSQGVFRLSLGLADIITGLIILPTSASVLLKNYQLGIKLQSPVVVFGLGKYSNNVTFTQTTLSVDMLQTYHMAGQELFDSTYRNSIGFFTTLTLTVSIYLLTVSGIDRLRAVAKPLEYPQFKAKRFAVLSSFICWIIAIILSIIPVFLSNIFYTVTNSFVALTGQAALILYLVAFFIPLLATWIIALIMYCHSRQIFIRADKLSLDKKNIKQQRKLNSILSLLVFAFSLSILPTILVLVLVIIIPGTDPRFPQTYNPLLNNIANSLEAAAFIALVANSLWNCLIYSLRTNTFRKVAKQKYKQLWNTFNMGKIVVVARRNSKPPSTTKTNLQLRSKTTTQVESSIHQKKKQTLKS